MHHIYHTSGFILDSRTIGESNRLLYIYTKQFGNITAIAQGVRELKSKLRFNATDFSMSDVSMVRGKHMWRITNAQAHALYYLFFDSPEKKRIVVHIAMLIKRLVPGEEKNEELFSVLEHFVDILKRESLSKKELRGAELIVNLQILNTLGYGTNDAALQQFLHTPLTRELLAQMNGSEKRAVSEINTALAESQL